MNDTLTDTKTTDDLRWPFGANGGANRKIHSNAAKTSSSAPLFETPSPLLNRKSIAETNAYYRSLSFDTQTDINPLIAAAAALLTLNTKLKYLSTHDNISKLYQSLIHEINAFDTTAQKRGYRAETILIARYVLCSVLDETILQTDWGKNSLWQQQKLLSSFQREQSVDDRFFLILDRISENPATHIELLELIYIALRLGFKGKYSLNRTDDSAKQIELDKIVDALYHRIRLQRAEPKSLIHSNFVAREKIHPTVKKRSLWSFTWKTAATTTVLMMAIYFCFAYLFNSITTPFQQEVQTVVKSLVPPTPNHPSP